MLDAVIRRLVLIPCVSLALCCLFAAPPALASKAHSGPRADPPGVLPLAKPLPNAQAGLQKRYSGTPVDVLTYHYDDYRTGWNQTETDLNAASVASPNFGLLQTLQVDGLVLTQPLLVSGFRMPDGTTHDVLIVTTMHNTIYAFDAQSYAILWQVNLGPSQSTSDVGCGDVVPEYGIGSTPVVVRKSAGSATIFVISAIEPNPREFHAMLHSINLADGTDRLPPSEIMPTGTLNDGSTISFQPMNQWSRAGLAFANNSIYVAIGSHCDDNAPNISGWVLRYSQALKLTNSFHTIDIPDSYELASVWMAGAAPAVDPSGNLFMTTGNGAFSKDNTARDYGNSVLAFSKTLVKPRSFFTPQNYAQLSQNDTDFASAGVILIPPVQGQVAPPLAVALGKEGVMYLLDSLALGGKRIGNVGALQTLKVADFGLGLWGSTAYYLGPNGGMVFAQTHQNVLYGYSLDTGAQPSLTQTLAGTTTAGYGGSTPVVSSNGAQPGTGVVWLIRRAHTVQLEAYDASLLGAPIYAAGAGTWNNDSNNAFVTPLEANGRVYVGANKTVSVFGLAQ